MVREIEKLNRQELENGVPIGASWHNDYNDTAYIYFGGLHYGLNEGDVLTIFSQYGVPVHVKLSRHKDTGKSMGFGFLKYEDQRSTVLAVDNLNGVEILGRKLRVDHTYYKVPDPEELKAEMAFDDYLDKEEKEEERKKSDKSRHTSKRDRHESDRRHRQHDNHGSSSSSRRHRDKDTDRKSRYHRSSSRRSRSPLKTEDDLEKEQEDPMASYFREKKSRP